MKKYFNFLLILGVIMESFAFSHAVEVDPENSVCRIEGIEFPVVGFGTYPLKGPVCAQAIQEAAEIGYRMIDTATFYENFDGIAAALKDLDRKQFYLISKVWHEAQAPEDLQRDFDATLKALDTDYLDAYLLHWPNSKIPIDKTLTAMQELQRQKKLRHIGLSNVMINHLKKALSVGVPIAWVQIEMHPFFYDPALLAFCREQGIVVQAWRPLGWERVQEDAMLSAIGKKYGKTACQIALRWIVQHECIPLPRSKNRQHIQENFDIADFVLSNKDMEQIDERASKGPRFRLTPDFGFGFTDEFDFSYEECWPNICYSSPKEKE